MDTIKKMCIALRWKQPTFLTVPKQKPRTQSCEWKHTTKGKNKTERSMSTSAKSSVCPANNVNLLILAGIRDLQTRLWRGSAVLQHLPRISNSGRVRHLIRQTLATRISNPHCSEAEITVRLTELSLSQKL
jgi:hypothetical protein